MPLRNRGFNILEILPSHAARQRLSLITLSLFFFFYYSMVPGLMEAITSPGIHFLPPILPDGAWLAWVLSAESILLTPTLSLAGSGSCR